MLREMGGEGVLDVGLKRDWYHSAGGDLFVWRDGKGAVAAMEASCFDRSEQRREWWLYWNGETVKTGLVDSREVDGRAHDLRSPVVDVTQDSRDEALRRVKDFLLKEGRNLPTDLHAVLDTGVFKT